MNLYVLAREIRVQSSAPILPRTLGVAASNTETAARRRGAHPGSSTAPTWCSRTRAMREAWPVQGLVSCLRMCTCALRLVDWCACATPSFSCACLKQGVIFLKVALSIVLLSRFMQIRKDCECMAAAFTRREVHVMRASKYWSRHSFLTLQG